MSSPLIEEFDIILAGGGTAACIVAARLADADAALNILVVEAGPHVQNDLAHQQPARFFSHISPGSKTASFLVANPEPQLNNVPKIISTAHCVGGGSSISLMMYTRGAASEYDDWETEYGNKGWGSKDLIPLMKKVETYEVAGGKDDAHGYTGPLKVSYGGWFSNVGKDYLGVGPKYEKREVGDDGNGPFELNKYARWPKWIGQKAGIRSSVADYFIYNKARRNLTIISGCLVKRVIFEGSRAVGIECMENPRVHSAATGKITTIRATRLVVVSSGAIGSPAILERSGIGAKDVLEKAGVKQLVDLPGVGSEYQDHLLLFTPFLASPETRTIDSIIPGEGPDFDKWSKQWLEDGAGLMATNSVDACMRLRPTAEELEMIGPAFQERWNTYYKPSPDKPVMLHMALNILARDPEGVESQFFSMGMFTAHPTGRGWIHIRDGQDPTVQQELVTGLLSTADDIALCKFGYKRTREIARRMSCYRGEHAPGHPVFPEGSQASCGPAPGPVPLEAPDIEYTEQDDEVIVEYLKDVIKASWHSLGTCPMKPRDQGGVVDSKLNVYGVEGLKICDMSIAPSNVSANTCSTAFTIAEKAAMIIAEELGIVGGV